MRQLDAKSQTPPGQVEPSDRRSSLRRMFEPRAVALVGATEKAGSVGRTLLENLRSGGFNGAIYPVNPKRQRVLGLKAYKSIGALPAPVDLAVIAIPAASVPGIVAECAAAGTAGTIVISAGFKESGEAGLELERQIREARGAMRIIGPNCLGLMVPGAGLNATFAAGMALPGGVAFLSQSGALCSAVLDWSLRERVGFSAFVSIGSMLDVGWGDLIDYLGEDPRTKSVLCYMESVGDARTFLSSVREAAFSKPVIVLKVGRTSEAAKAAASHTGALTGSDAVLDAALRRVGALRVDTIEELFDMAEVLAKQPRPPGPRLAIVTNAGGPAVLATDRLVTSGGKLAVLEDASIKALDAFLPPAWSRSNPVDMLGEAGPQAYARAVEIVTGDPGADGTLVVLTPQAMTRPTATANRLAELARRNSNPLLASWMGGNALSRGRAALNAAGIPTYDYPDAAARAFALMWRYSESHRLLYERPVLTPGSSKLAEHRRPAQRLLDSVRRKKRVLLSEMESKRILAAYGLPVVEPRLARNEVEAVRVAEKIGYPVVMKLHSETITHKRKVGGVELDLRNATAVRRAWRDMKATVTERAGEGHFQWVTVQRYVASRGIELIFGSSFDAQFGPVILFGAGGELVETLKDRSIGLPPLTHTLARRLMEQTRIYDAIRTNHRGAGLDIAALSELLVRFSHLVAEQRLRISEIDINPLCAGADGFIALDARIVLHPLGLSERAIPRLAIRPYPVECVSRIQLRTGERLILRPIQPEDEELLVSFHSTLSDDTVSSRYLGSLSLQERVRHDRLARICFSDYDREMVLVAERSVKPRGRELVAVGRINRLHGENAAEFALLVSDPWQRKGLGRQLLKALLKIATDEGIERIVGSIRRDNRPMLDICRGMKFQLADDEETGGFKAEILL